MKVNCLEKNPCVEKYYKGLTREQRLDEVFSSIASLNKIMRNLRRERNKLLKG